MSMTDSENKIYILGDVFEEFRELLKNEKLEPVSFAEEKFIKILENILNNEAILSNGAYLDNDKLKSFYEKVKKLVDLFSKRIPMKTLARMNGTLIANVEDEDITFFSGLGDAFKQYWEGANRERQKLWDDFKDAFKDAWNIGEAIFETGKDTVEDWWADVKNLVNDDVSDETQVWVATETLNMVGGDLRIGNEGVTYNKGTASVKFTRQGSGESFITEYDVLSKASKGIFFSLGTSATTTIYTMAFNDVPTDKAEAEEKIKQSFIGGFRTTGFSGGLGGVAVGFGKTVTISSKTGEVDEDAWSGKANATSFGFGIDFSVGIVESVYKLKGLEHTWEKVAEHFTLDK